MHKRTKALRPPQKRGSATRERLLLIAVQSLAASGGLGLRFSQIAKAAKVPQPLMDYHFPSMESLLMEMVQLELGKLRIKSMDAIEAHSLKPQKALMAYVRAPFDLATVDPGFCAVWTYYYHLATVNGIFAAFNSTVRRMGTERITALVSAVLHAEHKAQYLRKPQLVHEASTQIQGLITGYGFMAAAESQRDFKGLADLAVKAVAQVLKSNFP